MGAKSLIVPVALIAVGVGWLLSALGVAPQINWIWTMGLAVVGVFAFVVSGIDKVSIVVGPFFILTSILSVLRQSGRLSIDVEVPILVIAAGVLSLIARTTPVPLPSWIDEAQLKRD